MLYARLNHMNIKINIISTFFVGSLFSFLVCQETYAGCCVTGGTCVSSVNNSCSQGTYARGICSDGVCKEDNLCSIPDTGDNVVVAVINRSKQQIKVNGIISDNENTITVNIQDVPNGKFTIIKNELNDTGETWRGWEIVFGPNTKVPPDSTFSSNYLKKVTLVPERNAIVFHGGEVPPGKKLIKSFQIEHFDTISTTSILSMSHNRITTEPTPEMIQNGFPIKPKVDCYIPLVIKLASFAVGTSKEGTYWKWETASETNNLGMNLWCAQIQDNQFKSITQLNNQLIPSKAVLPNYGASYSSTDYPYINTHLQPGVQHCTLEDVDTRGQCMLHCDQIDTVVVGDSNLSNTELDELQARAIALCHEYKLEGACLDQLLAPNQ
jgi:hypothetical protein